MWVIEGIVSKGEYNYAIVPKHPKATENGYVLEHRIIAEIYLGRLLLNTEIVHHLNENKKDNRAENLAITQKEHSKHHKTKGRTYLKLKCPWCSVVFEKEKRNTHIKMKRKYQCMCCSATCRGSFHRKIQLEGVTKEIRRYIKENIIEEIFIKKNA